MNKFTANKVNGSLSITVHDQHSKIPVWPAGCFHHFIRSLIGWSLPFPRTWRARASVLFLPSLSTYLKAHEPGELRQKTQQSEYSLKVNAHASSAWEILHAQRNGNDNISEVIWWRPQQRVHRYLIRGRERRWWRWKWLIKIESNYVIDKY